MKFLQSTFANTSDYPSLLRFKGEVFSVKLTAYFNFKGVSIFILFPIQMAGIATTEGYLLTFPSVKVFAFENRVLFQLLILLLLI